MSTVSIQALTNTGLFESASKAKLENKRGQISEWLGLELLNEQAENPTGTAEEIITQTHKTVLEKQDELKRYGKEVNRGRKYRRGWRNSRYIFLCNSR